MLVGREAVDSREYLVLRDEAHVGDRFANRADVRFDGSPRGEAVGDRVARLRRDHATLTPRQIVRRRRLRLYPDHANSRSPRVDGRGDATDKRGVAYRDVDFGAFGALLQNFPADRRWPRWKRAVGRVIQIVDPLIALSMLDGAGGRVANVCAELHDPRAQIGYALTLHRVGAAGQKDRRANAELTGGVRDRRAVVARARGDDLHYGARPHPRPKRVQRTAHLE